jgi:hypothetical protein
MTSHPSLEDTDWSWNLGKDYPLEPIGILRSNRNISKDERFAKPLPPKTVGSFARLNQSTVK